MSGGLASALSEKMAGRPRQCSHDLEPLLLTCSTTLLRRGGAASLPGVGRCTTRWMVPMRLCQKGMWLNAARAVTVPRSTLSVCVAVGRRRMTKSDPSATSTDCATGLESGDMAASGVYLMYAPAP